MELFLFVVAVVVVGAVIYVRNNRAEVQQAEIVALGEPPATVVIPVTESATVVVEGAGAVAVPAKKAKAKKPAAIKAAKPKAPAKPKAAAKPKAPKAKAPKAK